MPARRPRTELAALAAVAALSWPADSLAGAQQYEVLSASVRAALANAVNDRATVDMKDLDTRAWVRGMTRRVIARFPDEEAAREFLGVVRYEAMRAGLDPHLVLAVIDVESKFRKYAVSKAGARGLMQVMPFWPRQLGVSNQLVKIAPNIRMGCEILDVAEVKGGVQVITRNTVEIEGSERPACVVEAISRFLF